MTHFFSGVGVILSLELRQRVRGVSWYVLLGIFVGLTALVTLFVNLAYGYVGSEAGGPIFSTVIYFVLLLGTLVAPALSGNAINGDRDAGTLATTQVTLITTWQLLVGKFLAAWITALAFLAAAVPFLLFAGIAGGLSATTVLVSTLVLAFELGVIAAVGVGLSGILNRPLFSIVVTYLVVAALSVGTLIAFTLGGLAVQTEVTDRSVFATSYEENGQPLGCDASNPEVYTYPAPRFDRVWGILAANPYVILADAVPTEYGPGDTPEDMFGSIKYGARSAQIPPESDHTYNECLDFETGYEELYPTAREVIDSTVPSWFVGLIIHLLLAVGLLVWAWARTRTPARTLTKGSRIA